MLYLALIVSAILLLVVNLIAWRAEHPRSMIGGAAIVFAVLSLGFLCVMVPPVLCQAVLICMIALMWGGRRWHPAVFLLLSCAATLLVYGVLGAFAYRQTRQLQRQFAYVSLENRLPRAAAHRAGTATLAATERLAALESNIKDRGDYFRARSLAQLHEETLQVFVNRPGFGVTRMPPIEAFLRTRLREKPPIPQPGTPSPSPWLPESLAKQPDPLSDYGNLLSLNEASVVDFVTSRRHNFHAALMELFNGGETAMRAIASDLYAVAYRVHLVGKRTLLEVWPEMLTLGAPLPTMPLWLTESLCVPLELEAGYRAACQYAAIG